LLQNDGRCYDSLSSGSNVYAFRSTLNPDGGLMLCRVQAFRDNSYRVYMKDIDEPYVMSRWYVTKLKQKLS